MMTLNAPSNHRPDHNSYSHSSESEPLRASELFAMEDITSDAGFAKWYSGAGDGLLESSYEEYQYRSLKYITSANAGRPS